MISQINEDKEEDTDIVKNFIENINNVCVVYSYVVILQNLKINNVEFSVYVYNL